MCLKTGHGGGGGGGDEVGIGVKRDDAAMTAKSAEPCGRAGVARG